MKKAKFGTLLIGVGTVMIACALALFILNEQEQRQAGEEASALMPQLVEVIRQEQESSPPVFLLSEEQTEMAAAELEGHEYIGFVGIPGLNLELPVMSDWSYPQLKIAPCRYAGSQYSDDLVIVAHNYKRHFGDISKLQMGDIVTFTGMDGITTEYVVAAKDVLAPADIEEMTAGDYDLTLFTCTYGGKNRITLRCDRTQNT